MLVSSSGAAVRASERPIFGPTSAPPKLCRGPSLVCLSREVRERSLTTSYPAAERPTPQQVGRHRGRAGGASLTTPTAPETNQVTPRRHRVAGAPSSGRRRLRRWALA